MSFSIVMSAPCHYSVAPSTAPMDVSIGRTSPTVMVVSWTPLSYVEARGFISNYTVAYSPQTSGGRKRQTLDTMFQTVPGMDSSTTRIEGLDPDTVYTVQVSATTGGGRNEFSPASCVAAPTDMIGQIFSCAYFKRDVCE